MNSVACGNLREKWSSVYLYENISMNRITCIRKPATSSAHYQSCLLLAEYNLRDVAEMGFASFHRMHCTPEEEPSCLTPCVGLALKWTSPPHPGFSCPSWMLLFADGSAANKQHMSSRKIYGKGKGGDAGEYVYITAESKTEPSVFLRGCCRSLKCAIGKEFLKEHLFSDESPYLGLHSYF